MSRLRHIALCCILCTTALLPALARADPAPNLAPSPRIQDSYDLGLAVYGPSAAVVRLDQTIKLSHPPVAKMAALADQTRADELTGYHDALTILRRMGAPDEVEQPFVDAVSTLDVPVEISSRAKAQVPSDPIAQQVWSTLDEADGLTPDETTELAPWLKLSRGREGLWAYRLGCLIASIRAGIPGNPANLPLIDSTQSLIDTAPPTTPLPLTDALSDLASELKSHHVLPDALHTVDHAAAVLFEPAPSTTATPSPPTTTE